MDNNSLRRQWATDGCVLLKGVFDAAEVAAMELDFDRVVEQLHASGEDVNARWESAAAHHENAGAQSVVHTHNVQNYSADWVDALRNPKLLDRLETLIGPDLVLHHSKLFQKPPERGAPFPMHQDWSYFPTAGDTMLAAIIHLTDATEDMGCLRAFPGSHRLGRRDSTSGLVSRDDAENYRRFLIEYPVESATPYPAEAGDVFVFTYFTVHGSGPNLSDRARKTVLCQIYSGGDEMEPRSTHAYSGLVLRGRNHRATRRSVNEAAQRL